MPTLSTREIDAVVAVVENSVLFYVIPHAV